MALLCAACESSPAPARTEPPAAPSTSPSTSTPASVPSSERPLLINFTRDHCLPCLVMKPWVEGLRRRLHPRVDVVVVNVDRPDNRRYAHHFSITSVPAQVFVGAAGEVEARHEGVQSEAELGATLARLGWLP